MTAMAARPSVLFRALAWLDGNPYSSLFVPPLLILLQFLLLVLLVSYGFPDHGEEHKVAVSLTLVALFGLPFLCFAAMALGVRQAFLLKPRAFPIIGIIVNALYVAGFTLFFLLVLVLRNLT